jgi:hypothetical protein
MTRSIFFVLLFIFLATTKYTLGPIMVRFKNSAAVEPIFEEIPDEFARALFPQNFFVLMREFERIGFSLACHLSTSTITKNTHSMISLLVNRAANTFAVIACIRSLNAAAPMVINYVEFVSKFDDGTELDTGNASQVGVFYKPPRATRIRIPHLKDPSALFQVHLYLMKQRSAAARLPEPGTEKEHFSNSVKKSLAEQVELGFYFLDETKQRYRPTWKGAYRATYRLLWPMKQIHQRRQEQEGRRIAGQALGFTREQP